MLQSLLGFKSVLIYKCIIASYERNKRLIFQNLVRNLKDAMNSYYEFRKKNHGINFTRILRLQRYEFQINPHNHNYL